MQDSEFVVLQHLSSIAPVQSEPQAARAPVASIRTAPVVKSLWTENCMMGRIIWIGVREVDRVLHWKR